MCKIFVKPLGIKAMPKFKDLLNAWNWNKDGCGISYSHMEDEKAHYIKGLMSFYDFMDTYMGLPFHNKPDEYTIVLHFRIATMGEVNKLTTHPFPADSLAFGLVSGEDGLLLSNNGMLDDGKSLITPEQKKKNYSDSMAFTENVIAQMSDYDLLEGKIGYNKVVLLTGCGEYKIINASMGAFDEKGIWHSNKTY